MRTVVSCGRLIFAALAFHATLASAELWGYVDDGGVAHFATHRVDERYQLFFRGPTSLDAPDTRAPAPRGSLEQTALYRRVIDHPNLRLHLDLMNMVSQRSFHHTSGLVERTFDLERLIPYPETPHVHLRSRKPDEVHR